MLPEQLVDHLKELKLVDTEKKSSIPSTADSSNVPKNAETVLALSDPILDSATTNTKKRKIDRFIDGISAKEQEELSEDFAEMLFASGLPFYFAKNPSFVSWIKKLRPSFVLPSRSQVATKYLDRSYQKLKTQVSEVLQKKQKKWITVVTD